MPLVDTINSRRAICMKFLKLRNIVSLFLISTVAHSPIALAYDAACDPSISMRVDYEKVIQSNSKEAMPLYNLVISVTPETNSKLQIFLDSYKLIRVYVCVDGELVANLRADNPGSPKHAVQNRYWIFGVIKFQHGALSIVEKLINHTGIITISGSEK